MKLNKRKVHIVILSDVHLGTYGCHAEELLQYLKSVEVETLVLNGDIFDAWNFSKKYFPVAHMKVIRYILKMAIDGTQVIYITGNHDEVLRKYTHLDLGKIILTDYLVMECNKEKLWIFHGDIFDRSTKGFAKMIAKLGGKGYDFLILFNRWINQVSTFFGGNKWSLSKSVKNNVKSAIAYMNNFEQTVCELAVEQGYTTVVCGHIHEPKIRHCIVGNQQVKYMNSGDWIENLTALEYYGKQWSIYSYHSDLEMRKKHTHNNNTEEHSVTINHFEKMDTHAHTLFYSGNR